MSEPDCPRPIDVDVAFGWGSTDIDPGGFERVPTMGDPEDTYLLDQELSIRRGRQDWQGPVTPSSSPSFDIWDPTGKFSPTCNEEVTVGVPCRIGVRLGVSRLVFEPETTAVWATSDRPPFSVLGDKIWIEADVQIRPTEFAQLFIYQGNADEDDRGWAFGVMDRKAFFEWSPDGVERERIDFSPTLTGRQTLAVRWNGAMGVVFLYGADSWGGEWQVLDAQSFPFSPLHDSGADVRVGPGTLENQWGDPILGPPDAVFRAAIRAYNSDDPVLAGIDFSTGETGVRTLPGMAGETWAQQPPGQGGAGISNSHVRFCGPVVGWESRWPSGDNRPEGDDCGPPNEHVVSVTTAGSLSMVARMPPPPAALEYEFSKIKTSRPVAYHWGLNRDDSAGSSSNITEVNEDGITVIGRTDRADTDPQWTVAADPAYVNSLFGSTGRSWSSPTPRNTDGGGSQIISDDLRPTINPAQPWSAGVWVYIPAGIDEKVTTNTGFGLLTALYAGEDVSIYYQIRASATNRIRLSIGDPGGGVIAESNILTRNIVGWHWVGISYEGGSTFRGEIQSLWQNTSYSATATWNPAGSSSYFSVGRHPFFSGTELSGSAQWSNLAVATGATPFWQEPGVNWINAGRGWKGERAADRFDRVMAEAGLGTVAQYPDINNDYRMGPVEYGSTILGILDEISDATIGVIQERRSCDEGIATLRPGAAIANQVPALTLSARAIPSEFEGELVAALGVQDYANEVTVTNKTTQTSHLEPHEPVPLIWPMSVGVNLNNDSTLHNHAWWRLIVASDRQPAMGEITIDLWEAPHLADRVLAIREGDIIRITDMPPQFCGDAYLVVQGQSERWGRDIARVSFVTTNGRPWVDNAFPAM